MIDMNILKLARSESDEQLTEVLGKADDPCGV